VARPVTERLEELAQKVKQLQAKKQRLQAQKERTRRLIQIGTVFKKYFELEDVEEEEKVAFSYVKKNGRSGKLSHFPKEKNRVNVFNLSLSRKIKNRPIILDGSEIESLFLQGWL